MLCSWWRVRRKIQSVVLATLVIMVVAGGLYFVRYYTREVMPRRAEYRRILMGLQPAEVHAVYLSTGTSNKYGHFVTASKRRLDQRETAAVLPLINQAKGYVPDHAAGGWLCVLEIETSTPVKRFEFEVHLSENNGVLLKLHSEGLHGWNFGVLRDDALAPVLTELAGRQSNDSGR